MPVPKKEKKKFITSCKEQVKDLVERRAFFSLFPQPFSMRIEQKTIRIY